MTRRWFAAAFGMLLVVALSATPATASPGTPAGYPTEPPSSELTRGQTLHSGEALFSRYGQGIELAMQTDGNLVLTAVSARRVLWSTHTTGAGNYLQFQNDANVVVRSASGVALWSTHTDGTAAIRLSVTDQGGVVVSDAHFVLWKSPNAPAAAHAYVISVLVSSNGRYRALMQTDGNLVVSSSTTGALWSSGTAGHPGSLLELQYTDWNLVIYDLKAVWSRRTSGTTVADLVMQDDGNLVMYRGSMPVWSTHTAGRP